ncbi:hypothetical protein Efla_006267 [Eimeria flavescens]
MAAVAETAASDPIHRPLDSLQSSAFTNDLVVRVKPHHVTDSICASSQFDSDTDEFPILKHGFRGVQPTPPDGRLGCAELDLSGRGLKQLLLLCDFCKLLSLDVSNNQLTSLYPLRLAANLVLLNASGNELTSSAELSANDRLEQVDLSYNAIDSLGAPSRPSHYTAELSKRLIVCSSVGGLTTLEGANLRANTLLREVDISQNAITSLEHLPPLKCLHTLDVGHNRLRSLKGVEQSPCLVILLAEANELDSLDSLGRGGNPLLRVLCIHQNPGLGSPLQLRPLKVAEGLQTLQLTPGPMASLPHWRLHVVHELPQLLQLDGVSVTADEQLAAKEAFGDLVYIHRRVWEALIGEESFEDRRLLKLEGKTGKEAPSSKGLLEGLAKSSVPLAATQAVP